MSTNHESKTKTENSFSITGYTVILIAIVGLFVIWFFYLNNHHIDKSIKSVDASTNFHLNDSDLRDKFEKKLGIKLVASTMPTPIPGLLAVPTERGVFYVTKDMNILIAGGQMFDISNGDKRKWNNMTVEIMATALKLDVSSLPKDNAIIRGHGKLRMILFSDPDCPYCRAFERQLSDHRDTFTIEEYLYPLEQIHPNAMKHSLAIMCAKDKEKAMLDIMLKGKDLSPDKNCDVEKMKAAIKQNQSYGLKNHVNGTPLIYAGNGLRYVGPTNPKIIATFLMSASE